jgi:hypothetical protein
MVFGGIVMETWLSHEELKDIHHLYFLKPSHLLTEVGISKGGSKARGSPCSYYVTYLGDSGDVRRKQDW